MLRKIKAETGIFIEDTFEIELLEDGSEDPQYSYIETPIPNGVYAEKDVSPKWTGTEWLATAEPPEPPEHVPSKDVQLMLAIAELDMQRATDRLETEMAIADLAETILGGM